MKTNIPSNHALILSSRISPSRRVSAPFQSSGKTSLALAVAAAIAFGASVPVKAAAPNWNTAVSGNWTDTTKWSTGAVPVAGDTVTFNASGNGAEIIYLNGNQAAASLTFTNTGTTGLLGGISGTPANNTLTLTAGITVNSGAGAVTIGDISGSPTAKVDLILSGNQNITNSSTSGVLTIANGVSGSGVTLTTNGGTGGAQNNASTVFSGAVSLASLVAQGNNNNGSSYNSNATTTFNGSSTLTTTGDVKVGRSNLVFSGNTVANIGGAITNLGAPSVDWGYVTISGSANVTATSLTMGGSGQITGQFALNGGTLTTGSIFAIDITQNAGGFLNVLNGTQIIASQSNASFLSFAQGTGFFGGSNEVFVGNGGALLNSNGFNIGSATVFRNNTGATGILTKSGAGTLTLSGASAYTGLTTVSGGTLKLGVNSAILSGNAVTVSPTAAGTATLDLAGFSQTIGTAATSGLNLGGGTTTSAATVTNSTGTSVLTLAGTTSALSYSATNNPLGATISVTTVDLNNATQTFTVGDSNTAANDLSVSSVIRNGSLTKAGAGTLLLSGTNTYTGTTSVSAGKLKAGSGTAFANTGALALSSTGTFDLGGFNAAFTGVTDVNSSTTITNSGASDATLKISTLDSNTISSLLTDGPTNKLAVSFSNPNSATNLFPLNAANTYSGGLTLLNGTGNGTRLRISNLITTTGTAGAIVSSPYGTGAITIGQANTDKAQILFDTTNNIALANGITFNTNNHAEGSGVRIDIIGLTLSGTQTANLADANYSVRNGSANSATITGQVTGAQGLALSRSAGGGSLTLTLNNATANANNYAGNTTIGTATTLALGAADQIPDGTGKGNVAVTGTLNLSGRNETINGLSGAGIVDGGSGTPTLTVGNNDATSTFSGAIQNTSGTLALTKTGTGVQTLTGANTYAGMTSVTGGTLLVSGTGAINSTTGITVNGSTAKYVQTSSTASTRTITLTQGIVDGTGTIGTVNVGAGTGGIVQNGNGTAARLTIGALSFGGNATVNIIESLTDPALPRIAVTGALAATGTITINGSGAFTNGLNYLIGYNSLAGSLSNFTLGTISGLGPRQALGALSLQGNNLALTINGDSPYWSGLDNSNWVVGTTGANGNWKLLSSDAKTDYIQNDIVLFNDNGAGANPGTVTISTAAVSPVSVEFNNNTLAYTVGGSFGIAGIGSVTKNGTGTVTLNTANTYTGGTVINAGTLAVGNATALGAATNAALSFGAGSTGKLQLKANSITLTDLNTNATVGTPVIENGTAGTATLAVNTTNADTYAGVLQDGAAGVLALTKSGAGSLKLSGANSYTGATSVTAGTLNLTGSLAGSNVSTSGNGIFTQASTGGISGGGVTFTQGSSGTSILAGTNTYTGVTTVSGGTLSLGDGTTGNDGTISDSSNIANSGALIFNRFGASSYGGAISGTGTLTKSGAGTQTLSGALSYSGNTVISTGKLILSGNNTFTGSLVNLAKNATLQLVANGGNTTAGVSSAFGGTHTDFKIDDGLPGVHTTTIELKSDSSVSFANTTPTAGTGTWTANFDVNNTTGLVGNGTNNTLAFASGGFGTFQTTINVTGGNGYTLALGSITNANGAFLTLNASTANLTIPGISNVNGLTVGGAGNTGIAGVISGTTLTKNGAGTLTLGGANTIGGTATINAGTLLVSGTGAINSTTGITVNGSTAKYVHTSSTASTRTITLTQGTVDGTGTIGTVNVGAGTGGIVQNGNGTAAQLTIGTLNFAGDGAVNIVESLASPTVPRIAVTGALTTTGTITVNGSGAFTNGLNYLIGYSSLTGSLSNFTLGTISGLSSRQALGALSLQGNNLALTVNGDSPYWSGLDSSNWVVGTTGANGNWKLVSNDAKTDYIEGDIVLFNDYGTGTVTISDATVSPASVEFNNNSVAYTVGGGFGIAGSGPVTKNGTGTVTLNTANTYTGGTVINAGTLAVGNATALGAASNAALSFGAGSTGKLQLNANSITLTDLNTNATVGTPVIENGTAGTATLTVNTTNADTYAGVLQDGAAGVLALTKNGAGSLKLSGANTYTGATAVNGGTLTLVGSIASTGVTTIGSGATLNLGDGTTGNDGTISNSPSIANSGALVFNRFGTSSHGGAISGSGSLTKSGVGSQTLSGALSYSGNTAIIGGTLVLSGNNTFTGSVNLADNATLQLVADGGNTTAGVSSAFGGAHSAFKINDGLGGAHTTTIQLKSDSSVSFANTTPTAGTGTWTANFDVNNTTGLAENGTNNTLAFASGGFGTFQTTINVTGDNGYTLALGNISNANGAFLTLNASTANLTIGSIAGLGTSTGTGLTVTGASNTSITGAVSGAGGVLTKTGAGTLTLSAANTYTGATSVTTGTLNLTGSLAGSNISTSGSGIFTEASTGAISGSGVTFTQGSSGTSILAGTNTYTGATSVSAGTLKAGSVTAFANTGALAMSSTGTFDLNGFNAIFTGVTGSNSTSTITNSGASDATLKISTLDSNTISSLLTDGLTNKLAVSFSNPNSANNLFTLNAANTYSGGLTLLNNATQGTRLRISGLITTTGTAGAIVSSPYGTGAITIGQANTDKAQILFDTASNNTLANGITFNTNNHAEGAGVRIDITGLTLSGTQTANLADAGYSVRNNSANSATITGQVTGAQGLALSRSAGTGSLTLTLNNATVNANNYAGNTTIGTGTTLALGAVDQIPDGAGKGNVAVAGTLKLNGNSEAINGLSGAGIVEGGSGTPTLTVGNNDATGTFGGVIQNTSGTLALTKTGAGTQTLTGTNTYTGQTTVSAGTLTVDNGSTTSGKITGNAAADSIQVTGGTLLLAGAGSDDRIDDNAGVTLSGGALSMEGLDNSSEVLGSLTLSSNSTIDFGSGTGNTLLFASLILGGNTLNIYNWSGDVGLTGDDGTAVQDRLLFTASPSGNTLSQINFYSGFNSGFLGTGSEINFTGSPSSFEVVPVPEPGTIFAALGLVGLVGYRERRRIVGALKALA